MAITNLLATMVLVSDLNVIQTNSPEFQEYGYHAMITNAQTVASAWHLESSLIVTNQVTRFEVQPQIPGISGFIVFGNRYSFTYTFGCFGGFYDLQNDRMAAKTPDLETNNAIYEHWMRATNLLTMDSARKLAIASVKAIGMRKVFHEPKQSHQLQYEWKDGKTYLLPYYGFDWSDGHDILRMDVSGVSGKVVYFFAMGMPPRIGPPTNYFAMLGLPAKPIFVRCISSPKSQHPEYEILLDTIHWHQP